MHHSSRVVRIVFSIENFLYVNDESDISGMMLMTLNRIAMCIYFSAFLTMVYSW